MSAKRIAARGVACAAWLSGLLTLIRLFRRSKKDFRVYILEYHGVDPDGGEWEGTISQERFRSHVKWLKRHYEITTVADATKRLTAGSLDRDLLALTFDDGYLNNFEGAWPVLRDHGVSATIYLTTSFLDGEELWFDVARRALVAAEKASNGQETPKDVVDRLAEALGAWPSPQSVESTMRQLKKKPAAARLRVVDDLAQAGLNLGPAAKPMSWQQARELQEAGIELGAHTVSHPILSRQDRCQQHEEIFGSRDRLAEQLGQPPRTFAMPNGSKDDYDSHTLELLERAGFEAACTTRRGANAPGAARFELRRLGVGSDPLFLLAARLGGLFDEGIRRRLPF